MSVGVYRVARRVDTVFIEVDETVATQLAAILNLVVDRTRMAKSYGSAIAELQHRLQTDEGEDGDQGGGVRLDTGKRCNIEARRGYVLLEDTY